MPPDGGITPPGKTCVAITNLSPRPMMGIDFCGMLISAVHHEEGEEKLHLLMLVDHIPAGAKMYKPNQKQAVPGGIACFFDCAP